MYPHPYPYPYPYPQYPWYPLKKDNRLFTMNTTDCEVIEFNSKSYKPIYDLHSKPDSQMSLKYDWWV